MHLSSTKNDAQKIRELVRQKGALKNIICDIYGRNYGGVKELGLVDSTDIDDFRIKLESLKSVWDNLCPGFHKWFSKNRASFFEQSVIESAWTGTEVQGVYYNNSIESQHFREKMEQSYKKETGNFNIEETGRQTGRRRSKSSLRVTSLLLERTVCKIPNGFREMAFFGYRKTKEASFAISTAHVNNGTRV